MNIERLTSKLEISRDRFPGSAVERMLFLVLMSVVVASPCTAQSDKPPGVKPDETVRAIPATFFGTSAVGGNYPKVSIGTLAHQEFAWGRIEKARGSFDFGLFDGYVAAAQQNGLVDPATNTANMAITLAAGTPAWAAPSSCSPGASCTVPPDNIVYWTEFIAAMIQHYNGKTQPHIKYYELWNEFNVPLWWTGKDSDLVALAQAAYPIIHQDPYSMLLTPSVAGRIDMTPSEGGAGAAMASYLQAGGSQYADGGAFHGYLAPPAGITSFPMPEDDSIAGCNCFFGSIITRATQMREVFDQNGLEGRPMFQTEGSWGNNTVTLSDTQVAWVARYNLLQAGLRSTLNLQLAGWFTWAMPAFGWGDIADSSLNPTPAGTAYSQVYNWVVGAAIDTPCSGAEDGTWTCKLTRPGGYKAQAVWNTQGPVQFTPPAGYKQYRDLAGNTAPIAPGTQVNIGTRPILVEFIPDTLTIEVAKQKASGKLIVYATSTDPTATLRIKANPLLPRIPPGPLDLGVMSKPSPTGNEFFLIEKGLETIESIEIDSTSGGSVSGMVKHH
jgi:hypothetical protein